MQSRLFDGRYVEKKNGNNEQTEDVLSHVGESGFRNPRKFYLRKPESNQFLLWNPESCGLQSGIPLSTGIQNPESKFQRQSIRIQHPESGIQAVESRIQELLGFSF